MVINVKVFEVIITITIIMMITINFERFIVTIVVIIKNRLIFMQIDFIIAEFIIFAITRLSQQFDHNNCSLVYFI